MNPGNNDITQESSKSSVIIPDDQIYKYLKPTDKNPNESDAFCACGWPEHMLIPKGHGSGFPCVLFVMVTDHRIDFGMN